jgi:dolichol-phosphate hexosyltransferase
VSTAHAADGLVDLGTSVSNLLTPEARGLDTDPELPVCAATSELIKLSILMPVYNEEQTVLAAVEDILKTSYPCDMELIVVDDGSTDGTGVLLSEVYDDRVSVRRHPTNRGKGAALLTAASLATGTYILPFDADLEYSAEDIPRMLDVVLKSRSSIVYGARLFGCNTVYQSYRYAAGNRWLTRMANLLFDAYISDLHTCLKLMPLDVLRSMNLKQRGFGLDTELTALLLKRGLRPFEIPVSYIGRSHKQGKKITWRDAIACARILLHVRLFRRRGSAGPTGALDRGSAPDRPHRQGRESSIAGDIVVRSSDAHFSAGLIG